MRDQRIATFEDYVGELKAIYRRTRKPVNYIKHSRDAADYIRPLFDEIMDDHEEAKVIHLNNSNGVVNVHHCSVGGYTGTLIPIKLILQHALLIKTIGLVLVHNHPSGTLLPSPNDIKVSMGLMEACKLVGLNLLDSLIITREDYYSMVDEGDI